MPAKNTTPCISSFLSSHLGASCRLFAKLSKLRNQNSSRTNPCCERIAAVTPQVFLTAQEGLPPLRKTARISWLTAIWRTCCAPCMNCLLTSTPVLVMTWAVPARTSWPSPPMISAGSRGVGRPPSCSGQMGIHMPCCKLFRQVLFFFILLSYRVQRPTRHALTRKRGSLVGRMMNYPLIKGNYSGRAINHPKH